MQSHLSLLAPGNISFNDFGSQSLSVIANIPALGNLSLSHFNLNQYSSTQIPGLDQAPLNHFQGWQTASINQIPGLSQVSFSDFPITPLGFLGFVALHDFIYAVSLKLAAKKYLYFPSFKGVILIGVIVRSLPGMLTKQLGLLI